MSAEKSWGGAERRASKRVDVTARVEIVKENNERQAQFFYTRDLSTQGLFLLCDPPLALKTTLELTIAIPGVRQLLPLKAKVVRQVKSGEKGVGIEFYDTPEEFQLLLEQTINNLQANAPE